MAYIDERTRLSQLIIEEMSIYILAYHISQNIATGTIIYIKCHPSYITTVNVNNLQCIINDLREFLLITKLETYTMPPGHVISIS